MIQEIIGLEELHKSNNVNSEQNLKTDVENKKKTGILIENLNNRVVVVHSVI